MFEGQGYGSFVPDANDAELHLLTKTLAEKVGKHVDLYIEAMEKVTDSLLDRCCSYYNSSIQLLLHVF